MMPDFAWCAAGKNPVPQNPSTSKSLSPEATKTIASYFIDRFKNQEHIDDAHFAEFQKDFAATVSAMDRAHAFTNVGIFWEFWKNPKNQAQFLNSQSIRAKYGELPLDAFVGLVWSSAIEAKAAQIKDAMKRRNFIVRSYFAFVNNPTVRAVYTNSAVVFGWDVVRWIGSTLDVLVSASLLGALYAISGGATNNALNPVLRPMMDWLARWAPNNFLIRFLARHSQRIFTPQESAKAETSAKDAKNSLSRLADQLSKVDFTTVPLEDAKKYWEGITRQYSEANLAYISGLPGYLKDGRNFRNDAVSMRPLGFSQGITVELSNYKMHWDSLRRLRKSLSQEYGVPLGRIKQALAAEEELVDALHAHASRDRLEHLEAQSLKAREMLKNLARQSILAAFTGAGAPAALDPSESDEKIALANEDVDEIFSDARAMKEASRRGGAKLASWLDHNNAMNEYYWKNDPKLAEIANQMADAMGMDFFRQMENLRPHFLQMFDRLKGQMDTTLDAYIPNRKKGSGSLESENAASNSSLEVCLEAGIK